RSVLIKLHRLPCSYRQGHTDNVSHFSCLENILGRLAEYDRRFFREFFWQARDFDSSTELFWENGLHVVFYFLISSSNHFVRLNKNFDPIVRNVFNHLNGILALINASGSSLRSFSECIDSSTYGVRCDIHCSV